MSKSDYADRKPMISSGSGLCAKLKKIMVVSLVWVFFPAFSVASEDLWLREARGVRASWHDPKSERLFARIYVDAVTMRPGRMGGVKPVFEQPRLELWLDECSEEGLIALAAEWEKWVQAAKLHGGKWELVLWKSDSIAVRLLSENLRLRTHAPGVDLFGSAERRARIPLLSVFWRGPGRGVGYAVDGKTVAWSEFARAAKAAEMNFNLNKHETK